MEKIRLNLDSITCRDLRFPMTILVVFLHIPKFPALESRIDYSYIEGGLYIYTIIRNIVGWLGSIAVPIFFVISGYYFYNHSWNLKTYLSKLKKRFYTLFIPYILWIIIAILFLAIFIVCGIILHGRSWSIIIDFFADNFTVSSFYDSKKVETDVNLNWLGDMRPTYFPWLQPMWFVRDLMMMVIISPILHFVIYHFKWWTLSIMALSYISGIEIPLCGFSSVAIFFFSLGAFLRIHILYITDFFFNKNLRYFTFIISFILLPILLYYGNTSLSYYLQPIFTICMSITMFNLITDMEIVSIRCDCNNHKKKILRFILSCFKKFSNATFFIYASHAVWGLWASGTIIQKVFPAYVLNDNSYALPFIYILYAIMTVFICYITFLLLKRIPFIYNILTGGR